jgi:hypothetical protein
MSLVKGDVDVHMIREEFWACKRVWGKPSIWPGCGLASMIRVIAT